MLVRDTHSSVHGNIALWQQKQIENNKKNRDPNICKEQKEYCSIFILDGILISN